MTQRGSGPAWKLAEGVVAPRSDLTNWIGTQTAGLVESVLRDDLLAILGALVRTKSFGEAKTAFDKVRTGLGLDAAQFRDFDGYPSEAGEIFRAAEVVFDGPDPDGEHAVLRMQDSILEGETTTAGKVNLAGLSGVLREAADRYEARYRVEPDPSAFDKVAGAYLKARELYRTAAGSKLTAADQERLTDQHDVFANAIVAVEKATRRSGNSARGARRPQRAAREALSDLAGANTYAVPRSR